MLDKEIILVGYSGHAYVVAEGIKSCGHNLKYYSEVKELSKNPYRLKYMGFEKERLFKGWNDRYCFILGLGNNQLRIDAFNLIAAKDFEILNVIHQSASISKEVAFGLGNFVARNASINPLVVIGDCCIINTGAIIEHECTIGTGAHIAPGAVLTGSVTVGEGSFIGANSVIKEGVKIGKNVIVGSGAVVIRDVDENKRVVGNPLREI